MGGGPTQALAEFAAAFPGAGIPAAARDAAARSLLDTLACAVAGLAEESTCRFTHAPAGALRELMRANRLRSDALETIEARVTSAAFAEVREPLEDKVRPKSRVHAQFSLPYALACVADHGTVTLADLAEEAIRREDLLALAGRVRCARDPELEARWGEKIGEAEIRVRTPEGRQIAARALPPGGPGRPMEESEREAKIRECLAWGGSTLQGPHLGRMINAMRYHSDLTAISRGILGSWRSPA